MSRFSVLDMMVSPCRQMRDSERLGREWEIAVKPVPVTITVGKEHHAGRQGVGLTVTAGHG